MTTPGEGMLSRMATRIKISEDERERRSAAMRELNASGKRGRRRTKTDEEVLRKSLMEIVRTGTPRQRLDASKQLAELEERAPYRPRPDFEFMTEAEREAHLEAMVRRAGTTGRPNGFFPSPRAEFEKRGLEEIFDAAAAKAKSPEAP